MKFNRNKMRTGNNNMPQAPCIMEMSDIDFGSREQLFRPYKHSRCAEIFHQKLKEKLCIDVVASFAYGDLKVFPQMQLYVWVQDSEVTEQILQNTPYQSCRREHPLFRPVINCLLDALQADGNEALPNIADLWDRQQTNDANGKDKIYISITFLSYLRCYMDEVYGATKERVSKAFATHFSSYENLICYSFSLKNDQPAHNHLYLFMTPKDQERAETSGDIEEMRGLAYDIVRTQDVLGYIPYEKYVPQIANRRELTGEQLFFVAGE